MTCCLHAMQCCPAGKPTGNSGFCQACICTVSANFVPATLLSAGAVTNTTAPAAREDVVGSCAPASHVALLQLGALTENWSAALNSQCSEEVMLQGSCEQYAPKTWPVKKANDTAKDGNAVHNSSSSCPFQAEDIKPEELSSAHTACGKELHCMAVQDGVIWRETHANAWMAAFAAVACGLCPMVGCALRAAATQHKQSLKDCNRGSHQVAVVARRAESVCCHVLLLPCCACCRHQLQ